MSLSEESRRAIMLDLHQDIDEYADQSVSALDAPGDSLIYPPNTTLTAEELAALKTIETSVHLKSALKKIIADNSASIVFNLLNNIDGTTDPKNITEEWRGVKLVDANPDSDDDSGNFLHDEFYDTYWEYDKIKTSQ